MFEKRKPEDFPKDIQSLAGEIFTCPICTGLSLTKIKEYKQYWQVCCAVCEWSIRWIAKDEHYDIEFLKRYDFKTLIACSICKAGIPPSKMMEHKYMVHKRNKQ